MLPLAPIYPKFRVLVSYTSINSNSYEGNLITLTYLYFGLIPNDLTSNPKSNKSNYSDMIKQDMTLI